MTKNEKRDKQNKIPLNFIAAIDEILGKKSLKSLLRNCFKSKNKSEDEDEITWNEFTFWINTLGNHWYFFFRSSYFSSLVLFGNEVTQIQKYYVFLQGRMGKTEKTGKKISQLKWPKYQKPKDKNMGWMKHLFPKLVWLTVRRNCSSDQDKEIQGWRPRNCKKFVLLEQFIQSVNKILETECFFSLLLEVFSDLIGF